MYTAVGKYNISMANNAAAIIIFSKGGKQMLGEDYDSPRGVVPTDMPPPYKVTLNILNYVPR